MKKLSWFNLTTLTLGFAFLYIPMIVLIVYSFNGGRLVTVWAGFSTKWYGTLFHNEAFLDAAWVTIRVAVASAHWRDTCWCAADGSGAARCFQAWLMRRS